MVAAFKDTDSALLAVQNVPAEATDQYGIVSTDEPLSQLSRVNGIVEKPRPQDAPSTLAVVGRYLFTPKIFEHLYRTPHGAGGEIQLTDAISLLLKNDRVNAYRFEGRRFDCGSKIGFLEATVNLALEREDLKDQFKALLESLG